MEHDTKSDGPAPIWILIGLVALTVAVFAVGYWRFGSVWMGLASVFIELIIGAVLIFFGAIPE